jgi:hypothetical protein
MMSLNSKSRSFFRPATRYQKKGDTSQFLFSVEELESRIYLNATLLDLPMQTGQEFVIDDWDYDVTMNDFGLNYTGGDNFRQGDAVRELSVDTSTGSGFSLHVTPGMQAFEGFIAIIGGREKVDVGGASVPVPGLFLNTEDIYGIGPLSDRNLDTLRFDIKHSKGADLPLTIEFADEDDTRVKAPVLNIPDTAGDWDTTTGVVNLRFTAPNFDWDRLTKITFLVAPGETDFFIDNLRVVDNDGLYPDLDAAAANDGSLKPIYEDAYLDYVRYTSFLYFVDYASRFPGVGGNVANDRGGIIQDRATFPDQMTIGGAGFQLTSYVTGAEQRYFDTNPVASRAEAAIRVKSILNVLKDQPQGPDPSGTIGFEGFFYHFLGIDGLRKDTTELSTIDTSLALAGILTAQEYFDGNTANEIAIRSAADQILKRVNWDFMRFDKAEPGAASAQNAVKHHNQFYLGWKPSSGNGFRFANPNGPGFFSGSATVPQTIDFYTDEGLLTALLAMASPEPSHRLGREVWDAIVRENDGGDFVKSYPGSLFTYQFFSTWVNTQTLGPDNPTGSMSQPLDLFTNTKNAIEATQQYAVANATNRTTWTNGKGAAFWGLSATDGPIEFNAAPFEGSYFAEAAPTAALNANTNTPKEVGTVTAYAVGSSIVHTPELALASLWAMAREDFNGDGIRGDLLHPRFGFADAFNFNLVDAASRTSFDASQLQTPLTARPWANFNGFAIDHGPMLIMIDNYLGDNFIPGLFMSNTDIAAALRTLFPALHGDFRGTTGDDIITVVDRPNAVIVTINGKEYTVQPDAAGKKTVQIDALGGNDKITVYSGNTNDVASISPGQILSTSSITRISATNVEQILAIAQGGKDIVRLGDSNGNDLFTAKNGSAFLTGSGFALRADGFDKIYATASGGQDTAKLFDSIGNDKFIGKSTTAKLFGSGLFYQAKKFDRVLAYASIGNDIAKLSDSSAADTFIGRKTKSILKSSKYQLHAKKFDKVIVTASGGKDAAKLYDSSGNELFIGDDKQAKFSGNGFFYQVKRFEKVNAFASTGNDKAILKGSTKADKFVGRGKKAILSNKQFLLFAKKFDTVKADGRRGTDVLDARNLSYILSDVHFEKIV